MNTPSLTFFCELHEPELTKLFSSQALVNQLARMNANISMAVHDFSAERVKIVKKLTRAGVPVTAWLLLTPEEGYWTSLDTLNQTRKKYADFLIWTRENNLRWAAIGLDLEPRIDMISRLANAPLEQIPMFIQRFFSWRKYRLLARGARLFIDQIHNDGFAIESYQFPTVVEERLAESTLLTRLLGLPPLEVDREVLMLYTSMFNSVGEAILLSYARQATAVGVGSTGGGVSIDGIPALRSLRWMELKRDLLIASRHALHLYIFSLEGCVEQNFLDRLEAFDWNAPQSEPIRKAHEIALIRKVVQYIFWMLSHPVDSFLIFFPFLYLFSSLIRKKRRDR